MLEVRLLGQFDVRVDGRPVEIPSRPAQSLLAYLVLAAGRAHRREKLAGMLWPDSDESNARSNLRHALWRLRKSTGPDAFHTDNIQIGLDPSADLWADALDIRQLSPDSDIDRLRTGLRQYGGELLPGFYEDWVVLEREGIRSRFELCMDSMLERLVEDGLWHEVVEWAERWIALGHSPEAAYRAMMRAKAGLDDQAGLALAYERCRDTLESDLGVHPSQKTRDLFERLKAGSPPQGTGTARAGDHPARWTQAGLQDMLEGWLDQGVSTLDLASLALLNASGANLQLKGSAGRLVLGSALEHGVDLSPWLEKIADPELAIEILGQAARHHDRLSYRVKAVRALAELDGQDGTSELVKIAVSDEPASVRESAASAVLESENAVDLMAVLVKKYEQGPDASTLSVISLAADECGIPVQLKRSDQLRVALTLVEKRLGRHRDRIRRMVTLAMVGGGIAMALVANLQFVPSFILDPELMASIQDVVALPVWILSNSLIGLAWGALLAGSVTLNVSFSDAVFSGKSQAPLRAGMGAIGGLVHAFFLIVLALIGGFNPVASMGVYIPVTLVFGLLVGAVLSIVIPALDGPPGAERRLKIALLAAVLLAILAVPEAVLNYRDRAVSALTLDLIFALVYPVGLALAVRREDNARSQRD